MLRHNYILTALLLSILCIGFTSCDKNLVFENEGDCSPKVQFVFKKHRQALHQIEGRETDAFYSSVSSVHLFAFDKKTGELVYDVKEKTENLKSASELGLGSSADRCFMSLDLQPGVYTLVAWCGLDENDENNAFRLAESTKASFKECHVKRDVNDVDPIHDSKYENLYHGRLETAEITVTSDASTIFTLELTKNNNDIAVWVQHATANFEAGDFEVVYTDANGTMKFDDNSVDNNEKLEYKSHSKSVLSSSTEYNGETVDAGALVAHLSTSRLMEKNAADSRLEVRTKDGRVVFSIPFIKYVLQMQTFTDNSQYYLDCEDTYNCSFYLTEIDGAWMPARIIINNWVLVPSQHDEI